MFLFLSFLTVLLPQTAYAAISQQDMEKTNKANENYRQGNFEEAVRLYRDLSETYPDTAAFSYNLGNSLYRSGSLGGAILAYERALRKLPRHSDIRHNRDYVRGLLEYHIEDKRNWYLRAGENFLKWFTEQEIGFLFLLTYFLFMAGWTFALFLRRQDGWGWRRKTIGVFLLVFALCLAGKHFQTNIMKDAIIMTKTAKVRYGPSLEDQVAFQLGEGLKVYVLDSRKDWSRVVLSNGESGWVKNSEIALV